MKKDDLFLLAKHLELPIHHYQTKQAIKHIVVRYLIENALLDEKALALVVEVKSDAVRLKELEMLTREKKMDMQMKSEREKMEIDIEIEGMKIQIEREQMEHDRELQLKLKEIEMARNDRFDISKHVRFVPPFQDKEVDKYFLLFEKVAKDLNWPLDKYTILLQCVLKGKACDIYPSLSAEQVSNYQVVKATLLKCYQLVPEAYRQTFRDYKKESDKTFVEFAREKERLFERWCTSEKWPTVMIT